MSGRGFEANLLCVTVNLIEASERNPARVLIAGGGIAALEALLALRSLAPRLLEIELLAPETEFHSRPLSVAQPFGISQQVPLDLRAVASDHSAHFRRGTLASVDVTQRVATTSEGERIGYDALLIATGAIPRPVLSGALTFRGPQDVERFRELLEEIDAGDVRSVAFALPRPARWSLPLYELALMTAARVSARGAKVRIEFVTHEPEPLPVFGPRVSRRMRELLTNAGIRLHTSTTPLVAQPGRLFTRPGQAIAADRTVAVAKLLAPTIPGVPQGPGGFIPTDAFGRVDGLKHVYAAGDVTWFPVKQGGIATQQADAAASAIASDAGAPVTPEPFKPVLRGILLTGEAPQYLRSDEPGWKGEVAENPLWLPVAKIAGRHLGPYLAGHEADEPVRLEDLGRAESASDHAAALELALEAADAAAGWNDPKDALRWLGVAEGLNVALPMGYAEKRREWTRLTQGRAQ
jgi:sulfide:quinone oxidoreductase